MHKFYNIYSIYNNMNTENRSKIKYDNSFNNNLLGENIDNFDELIPGKNYILGKTLGVYDYNEDDEASDYLATDENEEKWLLIRKKDNEQKLLHFVNYAGRNNINNKYIFINLKTNENEEYSDRQLRDKEGNTNIWEINPVILPEISKKISEFLGGKYRKGKKSMRLRKRKGKKSMRKK